VKAAAYLRVSTEEQRERQTIETQRQFAERFFAERDIFAVTWYVDDGVSGTLPLEGRPEGKRLLDDARLKQFETVYTYKVDRLGRDPLVTLQAATDLANAGVVLHSMTESIDNLTPHGRFSLVMLCGVAGYERDNIVARSIEGTNRLAKEGAWLGGIVPFGYVVVGTGRRARLALSDELLPGLDLSEAEVVRLIYRLSGDEGWSCQKIADRLNSLGVPTVYVRDDRSVQRGKRQHRTSGVWRAGRIRNLLTNTTYKGLHFYGKRAATARPVIERDVPAIVTAEQWEAAQQTLRRNLQFAPRNARRQYLLRGLIKCALCGLTYCGTHWTRANGTKETFYSCNGRSQARGVYGKLGRRCTAKAVPSEIEDLIWADIEGFLRDPGEVLVELEAKANLTRGDEVLAREQVERLEADAAALVGQRDVVVGLFRRGRIDAASLDRQLDQIDGEETALLAELGEAQARAEGMAGQAARLRTAEQLLNELHARLDEPLTWELKRQLVELLVVEIRIRTEELDGKTVPIAEVTYAFGRVTTRTGRDSWRPPW
jgi:site-specific DNA recombinase